MRYAITLLALLTVAASPSDKSRAARPIDGPAQWFGPDAYPPEALRANQEGRVAVRLTVDPAGRPTGCEIASSSGSAALDGGTCTIAMARMTFTPALDSAGRTIIGHYPLAVRWVLPHPVEPAASDAPQGCTFAGSDMDAREKERTCRAIMQALGSKPATVGGGGDQSGTTPR